MQLTISARPPFALAPVMQSHGWIQLAPFEADEATDGFTYVARLESGRVVDLLIQETTDGVAVHVDGELIEAEQTEIVDAVTWMLGLDQDLSDFHALACQEPKLAHVKEAARGRILRSITLFEDVVKTILTTNTAWSGTKRMVRRLVDEFGRPLPSDPSRRAFPTAAELAVTDAEALKAVGLGYRGPYVADLARGVASGALDLETLRFTEMSTAELRERLLAIKGVGDYAAANLLMLLGRYDFVPVDSWALRVVSHEWYDGRPIGRTEVESAFEPWGEWKGLAYWFWDWSYDT